MVPCSYSVIKSSQIFPLGGWDFSHFDVRSCIKFMELLSLKYKLLECARKGTTMNSKVILKKVNIFLSDKVNITSDLNSNWQSIIRDLEGICEISSIASD